MKKLVSVLLALVMMLAMLPVQVFAAASYTVLSVDKTQVSIGEDVHVTVTLPNIANAGNFDVRLLFDKDLFTVKSRNLPASIEYYNADFETEVKVDPVVNAKTAANTTGVITGNASVSYNTLNLQDYVIIDAVLTAKAAGTANFSFELFKIADQSTTFVSTDDLATLPSVTILKAPMGSVSITLDNPAKGSTLPSVSDGTAYTAVTEWYVDDELVSGMALADTSYTAKVTLTAKTENGESFIIEGFKADGWKVDSNSGSVVVLSKTFDKTGALGAAQVEWKGDLPAQTYDGKAKTPAEDAKNLVTVTDDYGQPVEAPNCSFRFYSDSSCNPGTELSAAPTEAGTYYVKVEVAAGDTYAAGATATAKPFVIAPATAESVTGTMDIVYTKTGTITLQGATYTMGGKTFTVTGATLANEVESGTIATGSANENFVTLVALTEESVGKTQDVTVVLTSKNYTDTTATLTLKVVNKTDVSSSIVTTNVIGSSFTYDGTAVEFTKNATVTGLDELNSSLVYTFSGTGTTTYAASTTAPTNAGTYQLVVSIPSDNNTYMGSSEPIKFTINKANPQFSAPTTINSLIYNGEAQSLITAGTVTEGGTMKYSVNGGAYGTTATGTAAGEYTVSYKVEATENYNGVEATQLTKLTIAQKSLNKDWISDISAQTYTGSDLTPSFTVTDAQRSVALTPTTDYTYEFSNNTNAGTATLTITGAGNYQGTESKDFTINAKELTEAMVGDIAAVTYDGEAQKPTVEVIDGTALTAGTDYTVSYSNNTNAGTATATITGKGNYTGSVNKTFTINKAEAPTGVTGAMNVVVSATGPIALSSLTYSNLPGDFGAQTYTLTEAVNNSDVIENAIVGADSVTLKSGLTVGKEVGLSVKLTSNNYNDVIVTVKLTVVNKQPATVSITGAPTGDKTYGDADFNLDVTCDPDDLPCTWSSSNTSVLTVSDSGVVTIVGAGTADITATCENDSYLGSATVAITVNKANLSYSKTPGAKTGLVYTGSPLTLVEDGSVEGGTIRYKLDSGDYGTTVPTAIGAGTYTVYYKTIANDLTNYNDIEERSFTVTIGKAAATCTAPTGKTGLKYTGSAMDLINVGSTSDGEMQYSLDGSTYNTVIPRGTDVGTYEIYYKVVGDNNHNNTTPAKISVYIAKAAGDSAPTVSGGDCTTHEQNNGKISDVTADMEYKLSTASVWTKCTGTMITGLAPGTYQVRVAATDTKEASAVKTVIIVKHTCVFDAYTPNNNATCQQNDTETQHCTSVECTATGDTREIPNSMTPHSYGDDGKCTGCGAVNPIASTVSESTVDALISAAASGGEGIQVATVAGKTESEVVEMIKNAAADGTLTTKNEVAAIEEPASATDFVNKAESIVNSDSSMKNAQVKGYLDISVALVKSDDDTKLGNITETDQEVTFQIRLADTLLAELTGREVFVLREHDGEITKLPATLSAGILTFSSDKFSTYAIVAYEPVSGGSHHGGSYNPGHTVTSDLGNVTRVTVDGKVVDSKYYTVSGGNVVLSGEFMKTLTNGKHTVKLYNGSIAATGVITVTGNTVQAPRTGDAGAVLYGVMAISSVLGMGWVARKKRCEK